MTHRPIFCGLRVTTQRERKATVMWVLFAFGSALFAGLTSVLASAASKVRHRPCADRRRNAGDAGEDIRVYAAVIIKSKCSERIPFGALAFGAGDRSRTGTPSLAVDFESTTSTNSITPAYLTSHYYTGTLSAWQEKVVRGEIPVSFPAFWSIHFNHHMVY